MTFKEVLVRICSHTGKSYLLSTLQSHPGRPVMFTRYSFTQSTPIKHLQYTQNFSTLALLILLGWIIAMGASSVL